ncbi:MAG: hypothetical protein INF75_09230 [Roseomonas sp.]|nr:hypothetical protein [Roseomonas sp.]MCA3332170.1 hypothetical protein [Roseomonas sp.]MCA3335401.1 hypothetical protein [Roseomonas sp.]MCA3346976.1 hypothetical protein [Roseomonas sp.]MCA3353498.1 hypothetical protein [Roseomonas sp.]
MANISAIALVGQSDNEILTWATSVVANRAKLYGVSMTLIDLAKEDWHTKLSTYLESGRPSFCFSFQGFGMGLRTEADNLWTSLNIPFISLMGDAPFYAPYLHANEGPTLFHLYKSEDFRQFYCDIMGGKNFSSVFGGLYPPNPLADETPWHDRDLEIVYVKSGVDSEALRAAWTAFPSKLRGVIEDASAVALAGQQKTIGQIVIDSFAACSMYFGQNRTLLLRACAAVDSYVRAVRAERMLREVMRHGGHVFGDWPHIDKVNTQARFHGKIPAEKLDQLYSRSRILINVLPCTLNYVHERILAALVSQAFSISDGTAFVTKALRNYPNFKSVSIDSPTLANELDRHISEIRKLGSGHKNELQSMLRQSRLRAENEFSVDRLIGEILELAAMCQLERNSSSWSFRR